MYNLSTVREKKPEHTSKPSSRDVSGDDADSLAEDEESLTDYEEKVVEEVIEEVDEETPSESQDDQGDSDR